MNKWIQFSIEFANQRSYLDNLFQVYLTISDGIIEINDEIWSRVEKAYFYIPIGMHRLVKKIKNSILYAVRYAFNQIKCI
ncbi:MAG: hypothetical protein LBV69_05450 [Bacteroidales bacterium]|jgi:hypothetical protein|nr:hypothetical protein [Bacteroidales bacterium]